MEQFLSKHNIDKDTFETLVEESSDYDLPTKERISRLEQQEKNVGWLVELIKKGEEENEKLKEQLVEEKEKYITKCQIDLLKTKKIEELKKENKELKKHFNLLIELIKGVNDPDQLTKLQDLGFLK